MKRKETREESVWLTLNIKFYLIVVRNGGAFNNREIYIKHNANRKDLL